MAVILNVENLRKHFTGDPILVEVTFQIRSGDKIGLVGPNGCGKTTLLNILAGKEESEKGNIEKPGDVQIGYLEQRPEVVSNRTVLDEAQAALAPLLALQKQSEELAEKLATVTDEVEHKRLADQYDRVHESLLRHDAYHLDHRVERILHGVGFFDADFDKQVSSLSGGELNRLSLAKLLLEEPDIMLLDEPSNHLDLLATEWLEEFLKSTSAACILVSHDRYFLDRVTNRTFELLHGTVDDYSGNFSSYTRQKDERLLVQTRTYEKYVEEVEKAKDFIRRNHYGMKSQQAEDRRKKLERMMETPAAPPKRIDCPPMAFPPASRTGDLVFRCQNLTKGFVANKPLFRELNFDVNRGQRWAVLGPNGCGKTTLLKCLIGALQQDNGTVQNGQGVKIGYFDQQLWVLNDDTRAVDAIRPEKRIFEEPARRNLLGAFGLSGDVQLQSVGSLSGGQRCRVALAKLSAEEANVLILDEPTNHLDLWARKALEKAIREFDGTVLFISHDRYFVDQIATHLLIIQPDARFKALEGNYTEFRHAVARGVMKDPFLTDAFSDRHSLVGKSLVSATLATSTASKSASKKKTVSSPKSAKPSSPSPTPQKSGKKVPVPPKVRKFPYRKVSDIEEEIFARETRIMSLNDEVTQPHILRDSLRMKEIHEEIAAETEKLAQLYEHWEEVSVK